MAWCGYCGESFGLDELTAGGFDGRCPRCGEHLSPDYTPVASAAVHEVITAVELLVAASRRLADVAPRLHLDVRKLSADVTDAAQSR
jgi:hypothetical protein